MKNKAIAFSRSGKAKLAALGAVMLGLVGNAAAAPVSIEDLVTDVSAQASLTISEALPFLVVVIGGVVLFKMIKRFVK